MIHWSGRSSVRGQDNAGNREGEEMRKRGKVVGVIGGGRGVRLGICNGIREM
jgi:hypothetical protein